jgi:hypothetical protein
MVYFIYGYEGLIALAIDTPSDMSEESFLFAEKAGLRFPDIADATVVQAKCYIVDRDQTFP